MAISPLHPESVTSRPKLGTLEDAAADLDTSGTFYRAAQHQLLNIREYLGLLKTPIDGAMGEQLNDLETLIAEASYKAKEAQRTILAFHEAEFEYQKR